MSDEYIRKADALDAFGLSEKTRKYGGDHSGYDTRMLYEIQDTIEAIESADVVQVVHAEWITDKYGNIVCSKCNWLAPQVMSGCLASRHLDYHKSEYCWHCGAKMDARGEE